MQLAKRANKTLSESIIQSWQEKYCKISLSEQTICLASYGCKKPVYTSMMFKSNKKCIILK
jgi:hypothetical protein